MSLACMSDPLPGRPFSLFYESWSFVRGRWTLGLSVPRPQQGSLLPT